MRNFLHVYGALELNLSGIVLSVLNDVLIQLKFEWKLKSVYDKLKNFSSSIRRSHGNPHRSNHYLEFHSLTQNARYIGSEKRLWSKSRYFLVGTIGKPLIGVSHSKSVLRYWQEHIDRMPRSNFISEKQFDNLFERLLAPDIAFSFDGLMIPL